MMSSLNSKKLKNMDRILYSIQNQLPDYLKNKFQDWKILSFKLSYMAWKIKKLITMGIKSKFQITDSPKKRMTLYLMGQMFKYNLWISMIRNGMMSWLLTTRSSIGDKTQSSILSQSKLQKKSFQDLKMLKSNNF